MGIPIPIRRCLLSKWRPWIELGHYCGCEWRGTGATKTAQCLLESSISILSSLSGYQWWASCQIRKLRVAHAPGMPGTLSPPTRVRDPDMHHGTCVTHVPWCMPGSLTSGFIWSRWRGKRSRHSRRMHNPQFCVPGKRPMYNHISMTRWRHSIWPTMSY